MSKKSPMFKALISTAAALIIFQYPMRSVFHFSQRTHCILYDKPPRTGSTTISRALEGCLKLKGFTDISNPISALGRNQVLPDMLSQKGYKKSSVRKHVTMTADQVNDLWSQCDILLYVTSTRTMKERIWSSAKYHMTPKHRSTNLTQEQADKALKVALVDTKTEQELEMYPFTERVDIEPDYVIRSEYFHTDLTRLLKSLQCDNSYNNKNIHTIAGGEDANAKQASEVRLKMGDKKHRSLLKVAEERNDLGASIAMEI